MVVISRADVCIGGAEAEHDLAGLEGPPPAHARRRVGGEGAVHPQPAAERRVPPESGGGDAQELPDVRLRPERVARTWNCVVTSGRLAVYDTPKAPFELKSFPIRAPRAGEVLVKIRMSTICRSDIHSYLGHRPNPCPGVLGHEIIGNIVALGDGHHAATCAAIRSPSATASPGASTSSRRRATTPRCSTCRRSPPASTSTVTWRSRPSRTITAASASTATSCRARGSSSCRPSSPTRRRRRSTAASPR